jgi:ribosomal protein L25 (general stress protein Ctc)
METIDIKAEARSQVGKGSARAARRSGLVPVQILKTHLKLEKKYL